MRMILIILTLSALAAPAALTQTPDGDRQSGSQTQSFAGAEQSFSKLVQVDPSARNYEYLARAEEANGKVDQAIGDFQRSIRLGNHSSSIHYHLGLAYIQRGQTESAIHEFRRAVSLNPNYLPARYALGLTLLHSGRAREAINIITELHEQAPRDPRVWAALAEAQFEAGDSRQAVETAQNAIETIPNNARLAIGLASECLRHKQVQAARDLLEDASELMPGNQEIRILLAKVSLLAGEPVEALAVLGGMPSSEKAHPETLQLMGRALALTGKLDAAAEDLVAAMKDSPRNPRYLITYAWVQQLQSRYKNAITTLSKARALDPKSPVIPYQMAVSDYFLGQYTQVQRHCREVLELNGSDGPAYLLLGVAKRKQRDFRGAVENLQKAVSLNPGVGLFHRELGETLFESGRPAAAQKQLDQALKLDPKDAEGYFWRAKLLASEGAEREAIASLQTAVELKPNYSDVYGELAQIYTKIGQTQPASKALAEQKLAKARSKASGAGLFRTLPYGPQ